MGEGDISFLHENWCGQGVLSTLFLYIIDDIPLKVIVEINFVVEGIPAHISSIFHNCYSLFHLGGSFNIRVWSYSPDGLFSVKSYYTLAQPTGPRDRLHSRLWSSLVPPKIWNFVWKSLHNIFPVDELSIKPHIPLVSIFHCCNSSLNMEYLSHLLFEGELAIVVWAHFSWMFEMSLYYTSIQRCFHEWLEYGSSNSLENFVYTILPLFILSKIWKEICHSRYTEYHRSTPNSTHVIIYVRHCIKILSHFSDLKGVFFPFLG